MISVKVMHSLAVRTNWIASLPLFSPDTGEKSMFWVNLAWVNRNPCHDWTGDSFSVQRIKKWKQRPDVLL